MDYAEFVASRHEYLLKHDDFVDAGDLNLYGKFPHVQTIFPDVRGGHIGDNIHRCHLVEDFLRLYEIEDQVDKRHVSFSKGVRESLGVLMDLYSDKQWLIASDNYPYYLSTAKEKGLAITTLPTLGNEDFDGMLQRESKTDILLMTYPFKPSGQEYTDGNWKSLKTWLQKNKSRRVILDTVYVFDFKDHAELFDLFNETQQVILLYSFSKAFAAPLVAGFTFSFDPDVREAFKGITRDETRMRLCYLLLNKPEGVQRKIDVATFVESQYLLGVTLGIVPADLKSPGYLFYVDGVNTVSNVFTVPASVYGSVKQGHVVSTLGLKEK